MKKIAFISQPEYFRFIYEKDLDSFFEVKEFPFTYDMGENDFDDLTKFNADYNFFFRGEFFPESILKKIKGKKIALSSEPFPRKINNKWEYTKDSIKRYLVFRRIREKSFNYVFHYDISSLPLFFLDNLEISGEFVFPVATETYKNRKIEKTWDIFFIGRSTPHREALFSSLKHHYNFLHIAHGVWGAELIKYINQSKICLNAHAESEISWEPRMQMMLACEAFVMSEKITPNKYLRPNKDYIEFTDSNDIYEKASFYLKRDNEREEIISNSLKRVDKFFNSQKKFVEFIKKIESDFYPNFKPKKEGHFFVNLLDKIFKY